MKVLIFLASTLFLVQGSIFPGPVPTSFDCTRGPSHWCQNLTSAASCHATKHCIQTDWIYRQLPPDNSNICQTCLDMVKQARDQLLSNDTQELIKQVFEGTCALVHVKIIVKECDKIVDNFIPDLIDTLASEMNPQAVCSIAGLCNNELLLEGQKEESSSPSSTLKPILPAKDVDQCTGCQTVVQVMENKFNVMSKDDVLRGFLMVCRDMGSLSDACSNIILTYFNEIYSHIKQHFNPTEVCHLSGECSGLFHRHDAPLSKNVQITPISHIGFVPVRNDDPTCDFCKTLVNHLRDLLVANTTEEEFKQVMEGLCRQTKSFADECLSLVDEYYPMAYRFLIDELNTTAVCSIAGICPKKENTENIPIAPLLPAETADALQIQAVPKKPVLARVPLTKVPSIQIISNPAPALGDIGRPEDAQLPIDLLISPNNQVIYNRQVCEFCQYFLHYVQQALTSASTEEEIKKVIEKACNDLPSSINSTCVSFVDTYEPALVALLAQEIDPSQICPLIRACPSEDVRDVDIFMQEEVGDNSKCPLCLFAVQKLKEMVKDKKTEADIKDALGKLCSKLSKDLATECRKFVATYTDELVDMLIAEMNPKEICVYLKLCTDNRPAASKPIEPVSWSLVPAGKPETNEIIDDTINGVASLNEPIPVPEKTRSVECVLCEFIMKEIDDALKKNSTKEEIIDTVRNICSVMPGTIRKDCDNFIEQYADTIIELLIQTLEPGDICPMIQLCASRQLEAMKVEIFDCQICEAAVWAMEKILANPKVDHGIEHVLEKTCRALPSKDQAECRAIIEKYGEDIFELIEHMANRSYICHKLLICGAGGKVHMETVSIPMTVVF